MVHYIKRGAGNNNFLSLDEELDPEVYSNIGTTLDDYYNGKFVMLSEAQYTFREANPSASVVEVWNMSIPSYTPSEEEVLSNAKARKVEDIEEYSHSENVDQFVVNGVIEGWLTPTERSNYLQSITSAELLGETSVEFFVGNNKFALDLQTARFMLAKIQRYADASYIVTTEHKIAVNDLTTIEDIENFDVTLGYPEKLNFEI